jgi:hypothetical protein
LWLANLVNPVNKILYHSIKRIPHPTKGKFPQKIMQRNCCRQNKKKTKQNIQIADSFDAQKYAIVDGENML